MNDLVKYIGFSSLGKLGLYRSLRRKHRGKAVALTYHGVLPEKPPGNGDFQYRNFVTAGQFEQQIQFLLRRYRPLRAEDFYEPWGNLSGGFLITFDDGFRNNYLHALPILKKYGLQGCFFITTHLIDTREFLWTEQVTRLLEKTRREKVEVELERPHSFPLGAPAQRERASLAIRKYLKVAPLRRRQEVLAHLKNQLSDVPLAVQPEEEERYLFMTWDEVREMARAGQVIGSHTHTHPMLATLSEEESLGELRVSRKLIEQQTGQPCLTMSYPNGERENYSEVQIRQLQQLGYRCAFTQVPHFNTAETDRYQLRRVNISLKMSLPVFEAALCGVL